MTAVEWFAKELYEKFEMKGDGKVFDELKLWIETKGKPTTSKTFKSE